MYIKWPYLPSFFNHNNYEKLILKQTPAIIKNIQYWKKDEGGRQIMNFAQVMKHFPIQIRHCGI